MLGIATVGPPCTCCVPTNSSESDLGRVFDVDPGVSCGPAAFDDERRVPSSVRASRSVEEKNFFINSARSVGDAPLMDLPLTMVTFPVLASAYSLSRRGSGSRLSPSRDCLMFTAVKPDGGDCDWSSMLEGCCLEKPFVSAGDMGEPRERCKDPFGSNMLGSASASRLRKMAFFRLPSLWFSCRALPETEES